VITSLAVPAFAWGESSVFHVALGQTAANLVADDLHTPEGVSVEFLKGSGNDTLGMAFEIGMLLEGVHVFHAGGLLSTRHSDADVDQTVAASETVFRALRAEGAFG
jgi:glutamate-1-semialdehyde 2,1-aminomutase